MKTILLLIALCCMVAGRLNAQAVTRLTLQQAVEMARGQSTAARQATTTRETRYWEYRTFTSNFKPHSCSKAGFRPSRVRSTK